MPGRLLKAEPLHVAPDLLGCELASPWRRLTAFAIDCALLWVPTLIVALAWVMLTMRVQDPKAFDALITLLRHDEVASETSHAAFCDLAPLLVKLRADGLPEEVKDAVTAGEPDRAGRVLASRRLIIAFSLDQKASEQSQHVGPDGAVRLPLERLIPVRLRGVAAYGVAAVYFALLSRSRRGATLGKRVLGIRVVRLDGHPLSLWEAFERFVGYLHIPGTLGFGLLDLWRDPNRRMAHDRGAHTAVIRVRRPPPARSNVEGQRSKEAESQEPRAESSALPPGRRSNVEGRRQEEAESQEPPFPHPPG